MNVGPTAAFYAGVLAQAIFLLAGKFSGKDAIALLGCCGVAATGFIPGKHENNYHLTYHLFYVACLFSVAYAVWFKEKVLERINREILLVWTLIFLYLAIQTPFFASRPSLMLSLLGLSLLPVLNAFAGFDKYYFWKVYFYVWFLCVVVAITLSWFAFSIISSIFFDANKVVTNSWLVFFVGMSFLYLAINLWYVLELIPIPGKRQSFSERLAVIKADMDLLASDYDTEQARVIKTLLIFVLSASFLGINYSRHVVSDAVLVPILIGILPMIDAGLGLGYGRNQKSPDESENQTGNGS